MVCADYTAKQCVLDVAIPLTYTAVELFMTIFQSPQSYTVPCRYAVLCRPSQAYFFPCRTNLFDSNRTFQTQPIR